MSDKTLGDIGRLWHFEPPPNPQCGRPMAGYPELALDQLRDQAAIPTPSGKTMVLRPFPQELAKVLDLIR